MAYRFTPTSSLATGAFPEAGGLASMTLCCWVKLDGAALSRDQSLMQRGTLFTASDANFLFWRDANGFFGRRNTLAVLVRTSVGSFVRAEATSDLLNDTDWHHVAAVFEADRPNGLRLYVDGQPDPFTISTLGVTGSESSSQELRLAYTSSGKDFTSALAEAAVFSTALAGDEIASLARGVAPLALSQRASHLLLYQGLVRRPNQPSLGAAAVQLGVGAAARHPRTWLPTGSKRVARRAARPRKFLAERLQAATAGSAAGRLALAGVEATHNNTAGEVIG